MARLVTCGFELKSLSLEVPNSVSNQPTAPNFNAGRYGGSCYAVNSSNVGNYQWGVSPIPNAPISGTWYFRIALYLPASSGNLPVRIYFRDVSGNDILRMDYRTSTHNCDWYNGSTLLASGLGGNHFGSTWGLLRIEYKPGTSDGVLKVYFNSSLVINHSGNTNPNDYGGLNSFLYEHAVTSGVYSTNGAADDVALNDSSGTNNNTMMDDGFVRVLVPNANGDSSQFINSAGNSTNNYTYVDEIPANSTDYVQAATTDDKDLYNAATYTLQNGESVVSLHVVAVAEAVTADTVTPIMVGIKTNGAEDWSSAENTIYNVYKTFISKVYGGINPVTGVAWTQSDLDAIQIGFKRG